MIKQFIILFYILLFCGCSDKQESPVDNSLLDFDTILLSEGEDSAFVKTKKVFMYITNTTSIQNGDTLINYFDQMDETNLLQDISADWYRIKTLSDKTEEISGVWIFPNTIKVSVNPNRTKKDRLLYISIQAGDNWSTLLIKQRGNL